VVKKNDESLETLSNKHPLKTKYTFYFVRRQGPRSQENYEKNIKKIGSFATVEDFWAYYNHLVRPSDLQPSCDYHLFRSGIKPMWEDEANRKGGKFIVRIPKKGRLASRYWEDLVLAFIGQQFAECADDVCGVVVSVRFQEDIISVWNKTAEDLEARRRLHDTIKRILGLAENVILEYKAHDQAMKDNSSFRNTEGATLTPLVPSLLDDSHQEHNTTSATPTTTPTVANPPNNSTNTTIENSTVSVTSQ
jgi:translation initiation factor 4E